MKKPFVLLFLAITAFQVSCVMQPVARPASYKRVSFSQFFDGQIVSIPLALNLPSNYVHANGLELQETYSYWMNQDEIPKAARTGDLPSKTGYIYGKVSMNAGYNQATGKFTSEDQLDAQFAAQGMTIIERQRFKTKGYPILSHIVRMRDGKVICQMYVGTLISSNAIFISYRPPNNDLKVGVEVWGKVLEALRK
jgi:hypothetical protein